MTGLGRIGLNAKADYYDGQTAGKREIEVRLGGDAIALYGPDGRAIVAWPLATLRRLPGSGKSPDELRLIPDFESEERLVLRDRYMIAAIEDVAAGLNKRRPPKPGMVRRLVLWIGIAAASVAALVFVVAPLLSDTIAPMIPPESEVALGAQIADQIAAEGVIFAGIEPGACEAPEGLAALNKMVARLEPVSDSHVPLNVRVLNGDMVNAFALPGGHIFFVRGLLSTADSPEEAAGVLAHEIGHVVGRDPTRNILRSFASAAVISTVLGDFLGGFVLVALTNAAIDASYSREAEAEADQTALRLLEASGLPSRPLSGFFLRLKEELGDGDSYLEKYLASHPNSSSREVVFASAPGADLDNFEPVLTPQEWDALQKICD
ncbi:MAG: M48 family metallopeptidase [Rhodobacteraceae bacterium]|nr:M48 family metallopeptidase [Paracoccaceae bacterium]